MIPGLLPEHIGLEIPLSANLPFPTNPIPSGDDDGLSHMSPMRSMVPLLNEIFLRGVPTRAPGDNRKMHSVIQGLLNAPIPEGRRKEIEKEKIREREERMANKCEPQAGLDDWLILPGQIADLRQPSRRITPRHLSSCSLRIRC
jgi:RNA exonuclease 1